MTKRAPKARKSRSRSLPSGQITFGEALREMRSVAQDGVAQAIVAATQHRPPARVRGKPRLATGHQVQTLFDGVCEALADTVIDVSRSGGEVQMARLVGEILISHVERKLCAGRC